MQDFFAEVKVLNTSYNVDILKHQSWTAFENPWTCRQRGLQRFHPFFKLKKHKNDQIQINIASVH